MKPLLLLNFIRHPLYSNQGMNLPLSLKRNLVKMHTVQCGLLISGKALQCTVLGRVIKSKIWILEFLAKIWIFWYRNKGQLTKSCQFSHKVVLNDIRVTPCKSLFYYVKRWILRHFCLYLLSTSEHSDETQPKYGLTL